MSVAETGAGTAVRAGLELGLGLGLEPPRGAVFAARVGTGSLFWTKAQPSIGNDITSELCTAVDARHKTVSEATAGAESGATVEQETGLRLEPGPDAGPNVDNRAWIGPSAEADT